MIIIVTSTIRWIPIPRSYIDKRRMITGWSHDIMRSMIVGWSVVRRTVMVRWLNGTVRAVYWA